MRYLFSLIVWLSVVSNLRAGGFLIPLQGQKQAGMANVGVALPQDASVMFYNPGGLSFTQHSQISVSGWLLFPKIQFLEEGTSNLYSVKNKILTPFSFYASYKHKETDKWMVGIGVYTPYGAVIEYPSDWAGKYVITSANLQVINIQPTFSYNIANKVGIGVGFIYSLGSVDLQRALPVADTLGNIGSAELKGSAASYGFNAGIHYQITPKISVGVSYKHKMTYSPKNGTATFNVPSALHDSFPNGTISTNLSIPYEIDAGIAYKPSPKVALEFDVNYIGWSVFDAINIHFEKTTSVLTDLYLPRHFNNAFTFKLGGQYQLNEIITLRAGTFLDLSPEKDGYVPPEIPDATRYGGSIGLTAKAGHVEIDAMMGYLETAARTESRATNYANLGGTYKGKVLAFGLGINYNFYKNKKKEQ